jgi:hypothetical protein
VDVRELGAVRFCTFCHKVERWCGYSSLNVAPLAAGSIAM